MNYSNERLELKCLLESLSSVLSCSAAADHEKVLWVLLWLQILQNNKEIQVKIPGLLSIILSGIIQLISSHDFSQLLLLEYLIHF